MRFKQIIILLVIMAALAGAGVFAYKSFTNERSKSKTTETAQSAILPHGTELDFATLKKFNPSGKLFNYPNVTNDQAGAALNEIISQ